MRSLSFVRGAALAVGAGLVAGVAPAFCAALPPLNSQPSAESHPGKIEWADLFTGDLGKAEHFYSAVLGWTSSRMQTNSGYKSHTTGARHEYVVLTFNGRPIAGLVERGPEGATRPARWIGYAAVPDLDKATHAAAEAGGTVLAPSREVPARGRQAVVADPEGAVLGLIQSSSGDVPDRRADDREWTWFELFSRSPRTTSNFYRRVADYDVRPDTGAGQADHYLMVASGRPRAGIEPLPANIPDAAPDWIGFVRVSQLDAVLSRVTAAGGEVIETPQAGEKDSRFAIVSDSTGGVFGLVEFNGSAP